ncbi:hypothetical protein N5D61_11535 [Pseudomonas sp. GD03842]|uniref:hypothetical protein n=1 Tax=Pseudomonas sp. GD03842 TaxID=2975385 RepID=UPI0024487F78|nr:hypothetical protein [Pseudomonas sp. GD03842]MDH0746976.1 hypothetical protein [Pseudomonas sp. GD03842]
MQAFEIVGLLTDLKAIYHNEKCNDFDGGIDATVQILKENPASNSDEWDQAASIYRTMAGSKSGFSDVYVAGDDAEQRVAANARLDSIREMLWRIFTRA